MHLQQLPHSDSFCLILPPNLKSAIAAVTYIAEQLKKQDMGDSVRIDTMWCCGNRQNAYSPLLFAASLPTPSTPPPPDHRGLAVHRPRGGPSLPLVVCHHYHPGYPGHLLRRQFQLHTWQPLSMKAKTHTHIHTHTPTTSTIFQQFHFKHTFHQYFKACSMYVVRSERFSNQSCVTDLHHFHIISIFCSR